MSSIKFNSDFARVFELIEKSLNSNLESVKRYTESPTFDAGANEPSQKTYNPMDQKERSQESKFDKSYDDNQYVEEEYGYMDSTNYYNSPDSYGMDSQSIDEYYEDLRSGERDSMNQEIGNNFDDAIGASKEVIGKGKQGRQPDISKSQLSRKYSRKVSRERLREAVVWSEILGPPVCKSRHDKGRPRRYMKSH